MLPAAFNGPRRDVGVATVGKSSKKSSVEAVDAASATSIADSGTDLEETGDFKSEAEPPGVVFIADVDFFRTASVLMIGGLAFARVAVADVGSGDENATAADDGNGDVVVASLRNGDGIAFFCCCCCKYWATAESFFCFCCWRWF